MKQDPLSLCLPLTSFSLYGVVRVPACPAGRMTILKSICLGGIEIARKKSHNRSTRRSRASIKKGHLNGSLSLQGLCSCLQRCLPFIRVLDLNMTHPISKCTFWCWNVLVKMIMSTVRLCWGHWPLHSIEESPQCRAEWVLHHNSMVKLTLYCSFCEALQEEVLSISAIEIASFGLFFSPCGPKTCVISNFFSLIGF